MGRGLEHLVPENFRIVLIAKELPVEPDSKEQWYGTEYKLEKISSDFMSEIKKAANSSSADRPAELHLPLRLITFVRPIASHTNRMYTM